MFHIRKISVKEGSAIAEVRTDPHLGRTVPLPELCSWIEGQGISSSDIANVTSQPGGFDVKFHSQIGVVELGIKLMIPAEMQLQDKKKKITESN